LIWFCGLSSPELHIARVKARVAAGVLEMEDGQVISPAPDNLKALQCTPEWAKAILEAALRGGRGSDW
jgi:hypothetical protein